MTETTPTLEHGFSDRKEYWSREIEGKTVSEIAEIISDFENRATRDALTGLVNKEEFEKQFEILTKASQRRNSEIYVCFFDFDDLKKTNDEMGHSAGNELLRRGSSLLKSTLRSTDLLGRIGGDEFAGALEVTGDGTKRDTFVEDFTQRIISNLADGGISVSIGISKHNIGDSLEDTLDKAEKNMKLDKAARKVGRDFIKEKQNV